MKRISVSDCASYLYFFTPQHHAAGVPTPLTPTTRPPIVSTRSCTSSPVRGAPSQVLPATRVSIPKRRGSRGIRHRSRIPQISRPLYPTFRRVSPLYWNRDPPSGPRTRSISATLWRTFCLCGTCWKTRKPKAKSRTYPGWWIGRSRRRLPK